jgi:hypothetical protein
MLEEAINSLPGDLRHRVGVALRQRVFSQCDAATDTARVNAIENNSREYRRMDGLGELRASIPATAYHYWGQREGYDVWSDKNFMRKYLQDNPEVKVNTKSDKIQVGFAGDGFFKAGLGRTVKVYK